MLLKRGGFKFCNTKNNDTLKIHINFLDIHNRAPHYLWDKFFIKI